MTTESAELAAALQAANRSHARDYPATIGTNMAGAGFPCGDRRGPEAHAAYVERAAPKPRNGRRMSASCRDRRCGKTAPRN